jgi:hypothetical protein
MLLTQDEWVAGAVGVVGLVIAEFRGPSGKVGMNGLLGFGAGVTAGYLGMITFHLFLSAPSTAVKDIVGRDPVVVLGALANAIVMNIRAIPGFWE